MAERLADPDEVRAHLIGAAEAGVALSYGELLERLGDRTLVYAELSDGLEVIAETEGNSRLEVGDTVGLKIEGASAHLFDGDGRGYHAEARPE